ncbi:MAG TPA: winged helix-turn-helix domain-containing protein, partial [Lysobacter sp.]
MATRYRLDDLTIDVPRQRVERDGVALDVGGLSFRLLHVLLEQGQRVVGFDELMDKVWAPAVVNEETVTQRVRLLRQSLGDDGRKPRYLRSVRGQGYQLCASPQALPDEAAAASPRRSRIAVALAAVALVVVAVAAWWWQHGPGERAVAASPLLQRAAYYAGIGQRDDNERAIALYRQRLQEAPDDRVAQVGLSRAYAARACQYSGTPDDTVRAQALADRLLAAEPRNAAAHAARGYSFDCRGRIDDALRSYERAVQLDPGADGARGSAAYLYERRGRLADALAANLAVRDPSRVRFLDIQVAGNLDLLGYTAAAEAR